MKLFEENPQSDNPKTIFSKNKNATTTKVKTSLELFYENRIKKIDKKKIE